MSKTRVYELARELGVDNRELINQLATLGIPVRNHMSAMEPAEVDRAKRSMDKEKTGEVVEERIRPTVVRRRAKRAEPVAESVTSVSDVAAASEPVADQAVPEVPVVAKPAAVEMAKPAPQAGAEESVAGDAVVDAAVSNKAVADGAIVGEMSTEPSPIVSKPSEPVAERKAEAAASKGVAPVAEKSTADAVQGGVKLQAGPTPALPPFSQKRGPLSWKERLGASDLPPGVVSRGSMQGQKAAPLSAEDRSRIVSEHAAKSAQPPRRRELVRSAIGPTGRQQPQRGRPGRARKLAPGKKAQKTEITVPSAAKRVIRIEGEIGLQVLAARMSLKATDVLGKLMRMGTAGLMINSSLDFDTANILAAEFGFEVENVAVSEDDMVSDARGSFVDEEDKHTTRAPVITVMGHVDHGKTSLLDQIRQSRVAAGEAGGITQHLGAYRVSSKRGDMVFLDTPGHAAFTAMRARGATATDIVVLVVAADDGVMPQTKEAIAHAKNAGVPIVIAVNKIDKEDARPEVVMRDLANEGLQPEEWGGTNMFFPVSAINGTGVDELLDGIVLQSEILELKANEEIPAEGLVLESFLDKGRGPVANVLIQNGTLTTGSAAVVGTAYGKIRAMMDDRGKPCSKAGPSTPVEILGLSEVPKAGDLFHVVTDVKTAQQVAERRKQHAAKSSGAGQKASLESLVEKMKEGEVEELRLVVKADVQGSAEALVKSLVDLSTSKVRVNVIHSGAGAVNENDVMLAAASNAIIIGFHVRASGGATKTAKAEQVQVKAYKIIYEAIDDVRKAMVGLLKPIYKEVSVGRAEVRATFNIPGGVIAGCLVVDGKISRSNKARLLREAEELWKGGLKSLRRVKDDVRDVTAGLECGVGLDGFNDLQEGDIIECFDVEEIAAEL